MTTGEGTDTGVSDMSTDTSGDEDPVADVTIAQVLNLPRYQGFHQYQTFLNKNELILNHFICWGLFTVKYRKKYLNPGKNIRNRDSFIFLFGCKSFGQAN